jgi:SAM-dependent methyltransferase
MNNNLIFYSEHAETLVSQYDSVSFESVHKDWLHLLPTRGHVLDIGAGSGRDARYLSEKGFKVYAAEPVLALLLTAQENSADSGIVWLQDALPCLPETKLLNIKFDLILVSAVWMHLSPEQQSLSIQVMQSLLTTSGRLVITLRHGNFHDGRYGFPVNAENLCQWAKKNELSVLLKTELVEDQLGRGDIAWQTLVLGR